MAAPCIYVLCEVCGKGYVWGIIRYTEIFFQSYQDFKNFLILIWWCYFLSTPFLISMYIIKFIFFMHSVFFSSGRVSSFDIICRVFGFLVRRVAFLLCQGVWCCFFLLSVLCNLSLFCRAWRTSYVLSICFTALPICPTYFISHMWHFSLYADFSYLFVVYLCLYIVY